MLGRAPHNSPGSTLYIINRVFVDRDSFNAQRAAPGRGGCCFSVAWVKKHAVGAPGTGRAHPLSRAGGHRDTPSAGRTTTSSGHRVLRGGGGLPHTHAPDMILGIQFKSLDKHTKESFTFTFTYESHVESRDFTVKVLSDKLIHRKDRSQVYVRLNCDDDKSNPDPDKCHIEISNKDDDTTQTLIFLLGAKLFIRII